MTSSTGRPTYVFEGFSLDAQHRVLSRTGGEPILLAPKAFDTLLYFVEHRGELLDKRALLDAIWPNVVVEENNLNQCISTLRRVLGERPTQHRFLVTEPGRGYRFVASVRVVADEAPGVEKPAIAESGVEPTMAPSVPPRRSRRWFVASAILAAFALGLAWFWQSGSKVSPPSGASDGAGVPASPVFAREVLPNSVAVLPFHDASPDPSKAYIADGLHIDIISKLGQLGLNVINRDAVLKYSSSTRPAYSDIAAELRVQSILVGTIRYTDDEIRVDASLVDPATGLTLWNSEPYVGDLLNVFSLQADIATNVASRLNAEFSVAEQRRIETRPTVSLEALQAYFQAFAALDAADRNEALRLLERATELDPNFAAAYGQLALLYARSLIDWVTSPVAVAADELERRVLRNAAKALELDPRLAIAYAARGELHMYFWRWTEAESAFASAYELSRSEADILLYYAQFKTFRGEYEAALPMAQRLVELNPPVPNPDGNGRGCALQHLVGARLLGQHGGSDRVAQPAPRAHSASDYSAAEPRLRRGEARQQ